MGRPPRELVPDSLITHFGNELRTYRDEAGLSQQRLGDALGCTGQWIGQVEGAEKPPSEPFALDLDTYFKTNGTFIRIFKAIKKAEERLIVPRWFQKWLAIESRSHTLKTWQPLVVPGLLQTPAYARAVLARQPGLTEEEIDKQVAARLDRQSILTGDKPTFLSVILDEGVLYRPLGDAELMYEQLAYLVEMAGRPNISIHVIPLSVGGSCGLAGAFIRASLRGGGDIVYLESDREGRITDHPEDLIEMDHRFCMISMDALPASTSIEAIKKAMEERWANK